MSGDGPRGVLQPGWSGAVGDYAIDGGWACGGALLVVGDAAGGVFGFEGTSGAVRWNHPEVHPGGLLALAIAPGGDVFATGGQDGFLRLWKAETGEVVEAIDLGKGWVEHVAWSSDGAFLAGSLGRRVHVFDAEGCALWQTDDQPSTVGAIAWSSKNELATAGYGRVSFFAGASGELLQKLEWQGSLVSIALSPDANVVACGSQDNSVHFWRRSTGHDSAMHGYLGKPASLSFDDRGMLLATSGGDTVTVWSFEGDGPEGTIPGSLGLHIRPVTALTFAHRGRRLASGSRDGSVIVWKLETDGHGGPVGAALVGGEVAIPDVVSGLAWRPDDHGLAAFDAGGGVTYWRVMDR